MHIFRLVNMKIINKLTRKSFFKYYEKITMHIQGVDRDTKHGNLRPYLWHKNSTCHVFYTRSAFSISARMSLYLHPLILLVALVCSHENTIYFQWTLFKTKGIFEQSAYLFYRMMFQHHLLLITLFKNNGIFIMIYPLLLLLQCKSHTRITCPQRHYMTFWTH